MVLFIMHLHLCVFHGLCVLLIVENISVSLLLSIRPIFCVAKYVGTSKSFRTFLSVGY